MPTLKIHKKSRCQPNEEIFAEPCLVRYKDLFRAKKMFRVIGTLRGCPCKNRPLDFRPKTEFLQIFRVRQLVHVINKNGNNLAFNAIF